LHGTGQFAQPAARALVDENVEFTCHVRPPAIYPKTRR
jgi:hypothetical protein